MKLESTFQAAAHDCRQAANSDVQTFNQLRRRLERIAYRMLGSAAEAEDVVQDAWLRWNAAARAQIENHEAWLVSVTTRLSLDRLRADRIQRKHRSERGLSAPQIAEFPATPQEINERADDVSTAYLILLERLTPEARAAFLMHEVFDSDYDQIAATLQKTQTACRQLVSRAKAQLRGTRPRVAVPRETHRHLLKIFVRVLEQGDFAGISALLAEDSAVMRNQ